MSSFDEHLAQVVLDGARADEQLRADLGVRVSRRRRAERSAPPEAVSCVAASTVRFRDGLAGGQQLATGAFGERLGPDATEHLVRSAQLLARVHAPVLAAQPLAVQEVGAGAVDDDAAPAEPLDRLAVEGVGVLVLAQQRARPGLDAERPVRARDARSLLEPAQRVRRRIAACRCARPPRPARPAPRRRSPDRRARMPAGRRRARPGSGRDRCRAPPWRTPPGRSPFPRPWRSRRGRRPR